MQITIPGAFVCPSTIDTVNAKGQTLTMMTTVPRASRSVAQVEEIVLVAVDLAQEEEGLGQL